MKVVILAGGYGTRLSEETAVLPKPMIEIGGRPLLWHLMKSFSVHGFNEFVVALGYKGDVIKRYFLQYPDVGSDLRIELGSGKMERQGSIREDWNIELVDTGQDTMTGGRLRRLRDRLGETFLFTYGDGLSTVDVPKLLEFHRSHGKLATVTAVQPPSKFGVLQLDGNAVLKFNEKPRRCEHIYQRRLLRARAGRRWITSRVMQRRGSASLAKRWPATGSCAPTCTMDTGSASIHCTSCACCETPGTGERLLGRRGTEPLVLEG